MSVWESAPLVVAHRGGRGEARPVENTMAAFESARRAGVRAIELDVRTCAGGEVVVFHDATLERLAISRDGRRVADVSYAELRRIELGGHATVPLLSEVLIWARENDVAVNVELKRDVPRRIELVRAALAVFRSHPADVLWSSFDPVMLAAVAVLSPFSLRAFLTQFGRPAWQRGLESIVRAPFATAIHIDAEQARGGLAAYRKRGLRIGVWTINDPAQALELFARGVATVITDAPDRVLLALKTARSNLRS